MRIKSYWLFIFLGLTVVVFFFYRQLQPPLSYDFAPQFDGNDYRMIYDYFEGYRTAFKVPFPFHQRLLVPFLAHWVGDDIIPSFQIINFVFSLFNVAMLFLLWRSLGFELKWFWAGMIWLLFHWTGMIRLNAFDPITVDVPTYGFQALFLWLVIRRKFIHLLWLAPLAVLQKESFLALPIILLIYAIWHNRKTQEGFYPIPILVGVILASVLCQSLIQVYFPPSSEGKSAFITLAYHAKEAITQPFEIVRWLAAMSMAFGPALWLTFFHSAKKYRYDNTRNLLILFSGLYLAFGLLAGGDMTRIIYLGFPFISTWIFYELRDVGMQKFIWICILSLPLSFLWTTIPNPAWQWEAWQNWYPEFAQTSMVLLILIYAVFVSFIISKLNPSN